jgi:hypothetical protein
MTFGLSRLGLQRRSPIQKRDEGTFVPWMTSTAAIYGVALVAAGRAPDRRTYFYDCMWPNIG